MNVLILGVLFLGVALLLHLLIWRLRLPRNPIKALVCLFSSVIMLGIIFLASFKLCSFVQSLHIILLFFSFSIAYLIIYSAIEADSPSLVIVSHIFKSGKAGLSKSMLKELLGDNLLIEPRLRDLVNARLADFNGKTYKINNNGRFFILPLMLYRSFLGLRKGG